MTIRPPLLLLAAFVWWRMRLKNAWGTQPTLGLPLYAWATTGIIAYKFLTAPRHMGDRER